MGQQRKTTQDPSAYCFSWLWQQFHLQFLVVWNARLFSLPDHSICYQGRHIVLYFSHCNKVWREIGYERALDYMHNLVKEARELLLAKWKTPELASRDMFGSMALIQIPDFLPVFSLNAQLISHLTNRIHRSLLIQTFFRIICISTT